MDQFDPNFPGYIEGAISRVKNYQTFTDPFFNTTGLHPTAAGSQWIAGQVGQTLEGRGVHPMLALRGASAAPGGRPDSVVCNFGLQVPVAVQTPPVKPVPVSLR